MYAVVAAHCVRVLAVQGVEDADRLTSSAGSAAVFSEQLNPARLQIRSIGSLVVMDMINNQDLSCPERTSTMPRNVFDCLTYSDSALDQASQSTEPERAALIAQAQVAAIQAVAIALERLRDQAADISSAIQQFQQPR